MTQATTLGSTNMILGGSDDRNFSRIKSVGKITLRDYRISDMKQTRRPQSKTIAARRLNGQRVPSHDVTAGANFETFFNLIQ